MVKFIIEVSDEWFNENATVESVFKNADSDSPMYDLVDMISKAHMQSRYKEGTREFVISNDTCPETLTNAFVSLCNMYMGICAASNN